MIFGEGPIIKNIAGDLNKLFLQGSRAGQPINVEGSAAANQGTVALMADRDPVIRDISTGLGYAGREVTVSGTGALQLVNSLGRPLKSWSVELSPYQEGAGDPSPTNVRPIHGTDKLTITTAGKNLYSGANIAVDENTYYIVAYEMLNVLKSLISGQTYTCSAVYYARTSGAAEIDVVFTDGQPTITILQARNRLSTDRQSTTFTIPADVNFDNVRYVLVYGGAPDNQTPAYVNDIQIELGSTATTYTPYLAPSQTVITLPQTVYTGTIGSEGGESSYKLINARDIYWNISQGTLYCTPSDLYKVVTPETPTGRKPMLCNIAKYTANAYSSNGEIGYGGINNNGNIVFNNPDIAPDITTWRQYIVDNDVIICYPLAAPTDFPIPSATIPTPTGTSTTWAAAEDGIVTNFSATYLQGE